MTQFSGACNARISPMRIIEKIGLNTCKAYMHVPLICVLCWGPCHFQFRLRLYVFGNRESIVGVVTRLRARQPRDRGSIHGRDRMFLPSLNLPDWLCVPPSLIIGYRALFSGVKVARKWSWPLNCHLEPGLGMSGTVSTTSFAFRACTEKALHFTLDVYNSSLWSE
jgi:hypothetical protein